MPLKTMARTGARPITAETAPQHAPSWLAASVLLVLSAASVVVLYYLSATMIEAFRIWPNQAMKFAAVPAAFSLLFFFVRYDDFAPALVYLSRATALGLLIYLLVEPPDFTLAIPEMAKAERYVRLAYWPALVAAFAAFWRPSFLFFVATFILSTRALVGPISGYALSTLDMHYFVEMAQYLSFSLATIGMISRWRMRAGLFSAPMFNAIRNRKLVEACVIMNAFGLHLGNYFWSGMQKLFIGPSPLHWALNNPTENIIFGAMENGVFPFSEIGGAPLLLFQGFSTLSPVSNILVLLTQLFAIVCVFRVLWIKLATFAYDALHVGIYLFGGLFFWPWVWINLAIYFALRRMREGELTMVPKLACVICILLGGNVLNAARLAWYDSAEMKSPFFEVQAPGGGWVRVPVSFFLSHSYAVSHGYHDSSWQPGHYWPSIWGSTSYRQFETSSGCSEPPLVPEHLIETVAARDARIARAKRFIRAHHAKMLADVDDEGQASFYLRSHHHPSNPLAHEAFNALDLREVRVYRQTTESVCYSVSPDGIRRDVMHRSSFLIPVE